jgi:hypothetical protein
LPLGLAAVMIGFDVFALTFLRIEISGAILDPEFLEIDLMLSQPCA